MRRDLSMRCTSTMSAMIRSLVTEDSKARAARTIAPRFIDEHGSAANSPDVTLICSPAQVCQSVMHTSSLQQAQLLLREQGFSLVRYFCLIKTHQNATL